MWWPARGAGTGLGGGPGCKRASSLTLSPSLSLFLPPSSTFQPEHAYGMPLESQKVVLRPHFNDEDRHHRSECVLEVKVKGSQGHQVQGLGVIKCKQCQNCHVSYYFLISGNIETNLGQ
jgi:hypothetical protein